MAALGEDDMTMSDLFDDVWQLYSFMEGEDSSVGSPEVQTKLKNGIAQCENAIHMINDLQLFSSNEGIQEVATNEIRYLLVPALLGYFTQKLIENERIETIKKARTYFQHYIKLCKQYELTNVQLQDISDVPENEQHTLTNKLPDLSSMADTRQSKIDRYKRQKETASKLKELDKAVSEAHVDESVKRDYYVTLLKQWIDKALEELEMIETEVPILEYMAKLKSAGSSASGDSPSLSSHQKHPDSSNKPKPLETFILTKSAIQAQVYGAGYPGIPTYTIEEFAENQIKQGNFPPPGTSLPTGPSAEEIEKQDLEKEEKLEKDDPDELKKARDWDDWKDDHRRGWGNRQNMG